MKINKQLFLIYIFFQECIKCAINLPEKENHIDNKAPVTQVQNPARNSTQKLHVQCQESEFLNFTELSKKYIEPAEEYDVTTEDGYVLKLFRIAGNTSRVVLICHGVLCSSDDFLIRGNTSLFYTMALKGFDVWAINCRGNRYSRSHVTLNPDTDRQFWQYSMHEVGIYDYKTVIDFILQKTGAKQLSVAAHSEGTSAFFILVSQRPEYNKKVKIFTALAPITYLQDIGLTLVTILNISPIIITLLKTFHVQEFAGYDSFAKKVIDAVCSQGIEGYELCFNILGSITGFNPENIEQEFACTILGHFPAGTSLKNLIHYVHGYRYKSFVHYDYKLDNIAVYRSLKPPTYDLKKVTTKVALYAAKGDKVAGIKDVQRLRTELPNVVHYHVIDDDKFNHIDYMWGRNAHVVLYPFVVELLLQYA